MAGSEQTGGPVVVGYDGSRPAVESLRHVAELFPDREVVVASVAETSAAWDVLYRAVLNDVQDDLQEMASHLADRGVERATAMGLTARAVTRVQHGRAWQGLLEVAREEGASVVVVGARGMSSVSSAILGSVSTGVVHHADGMPVLVVTRGVPGEADED